MNQTFTAAPTAKGASAYAVITPVRNEEKHLSFTVDSMLAQKVPPILWVIVDDGSQDQTFNLAKAAAAKCPWVKAIQREDRGFRQAGSGVIEAFYCGYRLVEHLPWQFVVKLDGDLSFGNDYFEQCLNRFAAEPKLGIAGGTICIEVHGAQEPESKIDPAFHVRGATKIYRRECWERIGGLIAASGWDTVDEVKANMLGWTTRTFSDLKLVHHRPAGRAYGLWSNLIKNGRANYVAGYHPLFMLAKCTRRMFVKPYVVAGFGLWIGFISGYFKGLPQVADPELIKYFRAQQMSRLLGRKSLWG